MADRTKRVRVPITAVAVVGLGALGALAALPGARASRPVRAVEAHGLDRIRPLPPSRPAAHCRRRREGRGAERRQATRDAGYPVTASFADTMSRREAPARERAHRRLATRISLSSVAMGPPD